MSSPGEADHERPLLVHHLGGAGPQLLLVHGLGGDHKFWHRFGATLTDRFEVAAVDLPGHGGSPPIECLADAHPRALAGRVTGTVDDLGWRRPHVLGLSLGGWVALELAAAGSVASATALAPAGTWRRPPSKWAMRAEYSLTVALRYAGRHRQDITKVPGLVPAIAKAQLQHPERFGPTELHNEIDAMGHATGYHGISLHLRQDHFRRGAEIHVALGVAYGAQDRLLGPMAKQDLTLLPADAEILDFDDCNHGVTVDQPGLSRELLLRTVARAG